MLHVIRWEITRVSVSDTRFGQACEEIGGVETTRHEVLEVDNERARRLFEQEIEAPQRRLPTHVQLDERQNRIQERAELVESIEHAILRSLRVLADEESKEGRTQEPRLRHLDRQVSEVRIEGKPRAAREIGRAREGDPRVGIRFPVALEAAPQPLGRDLAIDHVLADFDHEWAVPLQVPLEPLEGDAAKGPSRNLKATR